MSKETRIGLLIVVTLGLLIWGYKFLKGKNLLSSAQTFYVEYDEVEGLNVSTPVQLHGFQVGTVQDMYMNDELSKVIVVLDIKGNVKVPKETTAEIITTSFMGGQAVRLNYNNFRCVGDDCAQSGDYLRGVTKGMLASMVGPEQAEEYVNIVKDGLDDIIDTLESNFDNDSELGQTLDQVKLTVSNLSRTSGRLDNMLAASSGDIQATISNLEHISGTLKDGSAQIKTVLANAENVTSQLSEADWKGTVDGANDAVANLKKTLATADKAIAGLDVVLKKVNSGEGSLGKLVNETELYENLNDLSKSFNLLSHDIRIHPERYRRILSKKTKTDPITEIPEEGKSGN